MITVFTTGGTFDKVYFDANSTFSVGEPQADPLLAEANIDIDYKIEPLLRKDSLDINDADRQLICENVIADINTKAVITHGTDGMVATAKALSRCTLGSKVVVLTGAMQPARMRYSDAPFNLGFAMAAVQLLAPGIYIAMNGRLFTHDNVVKNLSEAKFESLPKR